MAATDVKPTEHHQPKTLWRHGAGVGTAIGTAIATCVALGLSPEWHGPTWGWWPGVVAVAVAAVLGAIFGGLVGLAVPVAETKTDTQIGIH